MAEITHSKIPLDVDINLDPVAENVWSFRQDGDKSVADQQLVANTGYHFEGGLAALKQNQYSDGNNPVYSYQTEGGNTIELRSAGNDPTSNAPMNGVYLDGKFLDYVPANGVESVTGYGGDYDDFLLTDGSPIGMKLITNTSVPTIVSGTGGTAWTFRTTSAPSTSGWKYVAYGNGLWVAVAQTTSTTAGIATSPDGITWTFRTTSAPAGNWNSVSYGNGLWVAVATATSTTASIATSTDGITWTFTTTPVPAGPWLYATYGSGTWVAIANTTSTTAGIATSKDGITWTFTTTPAPAGSGWRFVDYGNGLWVAVAQTTSTTAGIATSPDGITWTFRTTSAPAGSGWNSISYGNGLWVAISFTNSTTAGIATSTDGITWTFRTTTAPGSSWIRVAYGNGLFVALSVTTSTTAGIATSPDGITWTFRTTSAPAGPWVYASYGNGLWVAVAATTSTTAGIATSPVTSVLNLIVQLTDMSSQSISTATIPNAGYGKPVALVKQALGNSFTIASTQYFLAADSATTYNIFDQNGVKQLTTSIPVAWAGGTPKYVWACKMAAKNDYMICALGAVGSVANPSSYMITSTGGSPPFVNTNTGLTYSWMVMQSKNTYNRVIATGQTNPAAVLGQHLVVYGYTTFTASYTTAPTLNTVTNSTDYSGQVAASSYAYVDIVHTDYNHYYSGYTTPATTSLFATQANSVNNVMGFGRLSWINETDNGGKPGFEFRLNVYKPFSTTATYAGPQFLSVGIPYGKGGTNVAIGTPISTVGEFDPSWGPQISGDFGSVAWRWNNTYYVCKISQTPIRPIQKITTNLYKINTISPINVVNVSAKSLTLGSNDYCNTALTTGTAIASPVVGFEASTVQWDSNQPLIASNSVDIGGVAVTYNSGSIANLVVTPLAAFIPVLHQTGNYYFMKQFTGTGASSNSVVSAYRSDGILVTGATLLTGFQNQLSSLGTTYVADTTLIPVPLGVRYAGYTIGTNSSATSSAFAETYITAGYRGVVLTSEWDGYILGNVIGSNAVSFALFNQPYLFDGASIYKMTINNGGVSFPLATLVKADGLSYLATGPQTAFFSSSLDNSIWVFDGGYTLKKLKRLDGQGRILQGNFSVYDSSLTLDTTDNFTVLRDGLWSEIPKPSFLVPDSRESVVRMYDTVRGTVSGNSFNWIDLQYYGSNAVGTSANTPFSGITRTTTVVPFAVQTGYIGPDNNQRMEMSSVTFAIYNEARSKITLSVTILGYDQDSYFVPQTKLFTINPKDYINGGIWRGRIQPQNQRCLGLSVRFECSSAIRIYDLQYHWSPDAQAIMQGGRTG